MSFTIVTRARIARLRNAYEVGGTTPEASGLACTPTRLRDQDRQQYSPRDMASPLRPLMQCPSCIRHYLSAGFGALSASPARRAALSQAPIRSKSSTSKKSNGNIVHVRLRKDVKTFGKAGTWSPRDTDQLQLLTRSTQAPSCR